MVQICLLATLQVRILTVGISFKIGRTEIAIYENGSSGGVTH